MKGKWEPSGYAEWRYYDADTERVLGGVREGYHDFDAHVRGANCLEGGFLGSFRTLDAAKRAVEQRLGQEGAPK